MARPSAKSKSTATVRHVKRRKAPGPKAIVPAPPKKSWADLPQELKLMISSFLEEPRRVISFKAKIASGSPINFHLAQTLRPPLTLSICAETRTKALKRYSSTLSAPYDHFRVDFETDTFEVAPVQNSICSIPRTDGMSLDDIYQITNLTIRHGPNDWAQSLHTVMGLLLLSLPGIKFVFPDTKQHSRSANLGSWGGMVGYHVIHEHEGRMVERQKAANPELQDMTFTCAKHYPESCVHEVRGEYLGEECKRGPCHAGIGLHTHTYI